MPLSFHDDSYLLRMYSTNKIFKRGQVHHVILLLVGITFYVRILSRNPQRTRGLFKFTGEREWRDKGWDEMRWDEGTRAIEVTICIRRIAVGALFTLHLPNNMYRQTVWNLTAHSKPLRLSKPSSYLIYIRPVAVLMITGPFIPSPNISKVPYLPHWFCPSFDPVTTLYYYLTSNTCYQTLNWHAYTGEGLTLRKKFSRVVVDSTLDVRSE